MGYELNRLMNQFGVSTPTLSYSGTARPVTPAALAADATAEQRTAFDTAQANYGTQKTAFDADRALFDKYKVDYQGRLENTPMYSQAQFQTAPSAGMRYVTATPDLSSITGTSTSDDKRKVYQNLRNEGFSDAAIRSVADARFGKQQDHYWDALTLNNGPTTSNTNKGIGVDQYNQNIRDWFSKNPNATPFQIRAEIDKYGISGYDVAQARGGSMWGAPLAMPTYGTTTGTGVGNAMGGTLPSNVNLNYFDNLKDFNLSGAGLNINGPWAVPAYTGGAVRDLAKKYAAGGEVRRFQEGGDEGELAMPAPAVMAEPTGLAPVAAPAAPAAAMPEMMGGDRNAQLMGMLSRYFPQGDEYGAELKAAREANTRESAAFQKMLQDAIKQPSESGPDKAEMYFRLAAAFGAPTKTGHFAESLGKVGEATAGIQKERRESASAERARKLQLGLEAQKMRMTGAKEDLTTLRQLASEGMKDKRAIATELIKEYVKSGQPQSSAGKQAMDEGLKPNTPEFQARVSEIADLNVDRQMAQINATLANMGVAQANAALQGQKFEFQQQQATKLTAPEMKLKTDTEDLLAQTAQGYQNIKRALALNPNTFDTSLVDTAQRKMLESVGSKDPKVANTRELENMLEKASLSQLKSTFPGAISNDERQALLATQGMAAKSIEERGRIMQNAADALKGIYARNKKRLNEINAGSYRATQMPGDE